MTTSDPRHPLRRRPSKRITAVLGGVVLAASAMFGTAVGPAAAAETPAEILTRVCAKYVPNPDSSNFSDCFGNDLSGANLTGANLTGAILYNASLTDANLNYANLNYASLYGANLTGANLTGADLNFANLTGANLTGANLYNTDLHGAILTGTSAIPADIIVPATSAAGAAVTWTAPTMPTYLAFGACTPASAALFPVGATTVTCTVTNMAYGNLTSGSGTFTVTVTPYLEAPSFTNPPAGPLTAVAGTAFTHTITAAGSPDPVLTATGLPDWLTLSPTGVLTGTPPRRW